MEQIHRPGSPAMMNPASAKLSESGHGTGKFKDHATLKEHVTTHKLEDILF